MAQRDKYQSFAELSQHEVEGRDYQIRAAPVEGAGVAILAPHGGKIEFLTSELAWSIAGSDYNCYAFEGIKRNHNAELHVTSSSFDEPNALSLVARCDVVVTVHGLDGDAMEIQVGGRDTALGERIDCKLREAGFTSRVETAGPYAGFDPDNICNRGKSGAGAQIEIRAGLRRALERDRGRFDAFVNAVRLAVAG